MNAEIGNPIAPRWLNWWAWLTVAAVCPLLFIGALVTTMGAGMADQRSVVMPHQAIAEFAADEHDVAWKVEHIHRLAGWFAGLCGIVLAIGFWRSFRGAAGWLGFIGLLLISCQGLLGIFRVKLNSLWGPDLAWIHGCFAQVVFAGLASLAVMTTQGWLSQPALSEAAGPLRRWSLACVLLVMGQLIMGGVIRHQPGLLMARVHIFGAFAVLAALLWLAKLAHDEKTAFRWAPLVLLGLLVVEIVLGVETGVNWMGRYFNHGRAMRESEAQMLLRTTHYFVGSLLFASAAIIALKAHRHAFTLARRASEGSQVLLPQAVGSSLQGGTV